MIVVTMSMRFTGLRNDIGFFRRAPWLLVVASGLMAHEIPADVTVQMFLKPAGKTMTVLVRVPLKALRDIDFPELDLGYLDVERLAPLLPPAAELWLGQALDIREGDARLAQPTVRATQVSIESDRSFQSYETAMAHLKAAKLKNEAKLVAGQVWVDVLLEYAIHSEQSLFSIRPGMERLAARVATVVRFEVPGGAVRAYEFPGDPGLVALDPRWLQAAMRTASTSRWELRWRTIRVTP